ncbi:hypothetical protein U1Q18_009754, partial [Sarracenia purpurea var. burkii]
MEITEGPSQISTITGDGVTSFPLSIALVYDDDLVGARDEDIVTKGEESGGSTGEARTPSSEGDSEGSRDVGVKRVEARSSVSDKEVISPNVGEECGKQLELCPMGDIRSTARVRVVSYTGLEVSSIVGEEVADGDVNGRDVSVSEVETGEGVNNRVISDSPVFFTCDGVVDAVVEDSVDSGIKVKQVREKSEASWSARQVFEPLPRSPLEANFVKKPQTDAGLDEPMGISYSTNLEERSRGPSGNGLVLQSPVTELVEESINANVVDFGDALKVLGKLPHLPEVKAPVRHSWANVVKGGGPGSKPRQIPNLEYIAPTNPE